MLKHSIRLLIHYLKFKELPIPYSINCWLAVFYISFAVTIISQSSNAQSDKYKKPRSSAGFLLVGIAHALNIIEVEREEDIGSVLDDS